MTSSPRARSQNANEQTPLLLGTSAQDAGSANESAIEEDVDGNREAGLQPDRPVDLGRKTSFSSPTHWLAPAEDDGASHQDENIDHFKEDGLLGGISRRRFRFIFGGIVLGYFVALFDSTLMASSHPVITSYFNASNSASWLSTAFLLTSTALQPLFGRVSDTIGRRPLYLAGLLVLMAATGWCSVATSIGSFIAARAVCGFGAAGVLSMGGIMVNDLVSIEVRGTYQAYINLFYGGGSAAGAAFGGFLCDKIGWRLTFALQVPMLLALFINAYFTTPESLGPHLSRHSDRGIIDAIKGFDVLGSVLLTTSVAFLILGFNLGGNIYPWSHPLIITSLIIAIISAAILIRVELKATRPVMPMQMLSSQPRANIVFNNFLAQIGINTIIFNAPLYFQAVKLDSPSQSGFRLAGPSVALTICGVSAGFIMTATGRMKELIVVGSLSMLVGAICLSAMSDTVPTWLATIFLAPSSIGQGLSFPASSLAVLATSTQEDQAVMTSTLILWRNLGIVLGVSISSLILQNALRADLNRFVTGVHKAEIIERVRKSVHAVLDLDPDSQRQVIAAYTHSLKIVFISAILVFVIVNILILTIRLPTLRKRNRGSEGEGDE